MGAGKKKVNSKVAVETAPEVRGGPSWWLWLAAIVGVLVVYGPALHGPLVFDDVYLPIFRENGRPPILAYFQGVRPLFYFSLALTYLLAGSDTLPYHLTNVALHVLSGGLVYLILAWLIEAAGSSRVTARGTAFWAALLFLFHPLQTESVAYITSRSETQSTAFAYLALAVFAACGARAVGWGRTALILASLAAGALTKEPVVAMAAVIVLVDARRAANSQGPGMRQNWRLHIPLAASALIGSAGLVLFVTSRSRHTAGFGANIGAWYLYLCTQFKVIWLYVQLFAAPLNQNLDHFLPLVRSAFEPLVILGFLGIVGVLVLAWLGRRRFPLAALGICVFLILLAPTSSVVPINDVMAERRTYLAFIGLLLVCAEFIRRWKDGVQKTAVLSVVVAVLGFATWQRSHLYVSPIAMWENSTHENPRNFRAWFQLGYAYDAAGRCGDAVRAYQRVEQLGAASYSLYTDEASSLECGHRIDEAIAAYRKALAISNKAHAWTLLAGLYGRNERWDEALSALDSAEKANRRYWMLYSFRGNVYLKTYRYAEAIEAYRKALSIEPRDDTSKTGLAAALALTRQQATAAGK